MRKEIEFLLQKEAISKSYNNIQTLWELENRRWKWWRRVHFVFSPLPTPSTRKHDINASRFALSDPILHDLGWQRNRGPVRGVLYVPRLNFKRFHVAISEGSHVAVGILPKATEINIDKFFCCDRTCAKWVSDESEGTTATMLGVSGCCSWSLKCVKVFWTWGRPGRALAGNRSFSHWSTFHCCLMTGFANAPFAGGGIRHFVWILSLSFPFLCFGPTLWVIRPLSLFFFKFPWRLLFIFSYVWYQLCWEYQGIMVTQDSLRG